MGRPENTSVVGTIGENFIDLWWVRVGKVAWVGEEQKKYW